MTLKSNSLEILRALFHAATINLAVIGAYVLPTTVAYSTAFGVLVVMLAVEIPRLVSKKFAQKVYIMFPWGYRESEQNKLSPMVYMMIAIILVHVLCSFHVYVIALEVAAFADPLARILGKKYGVTKMPGSQQKSIVGSLAFLVVAVSIIGISFSWGVALVVAIIAMVLECYGDGVMTCGPVVIEDNFLVPVGTGMVLMILI